MWRIDKFSFDIFKISKYNIQTNE